MERFRVALPLLLEASGLATAVLFVLMAALSHDDPFSVVALLLAGIAVGGLLAGAGALLRAALETAERVAKTQADLRALGNANIKILRELSEPHTPSAP